MPHTNSVCRTQKKGRWSSSKSRSVPPPKADTNATTHTPTASNRLRAAIITPDKAKATVAATSRAMRSSSIQGASIHFMGAIVVRRCGAWACLAGVWVVLLFNL